ncbi:MAG: uracil-DNA glycosylase [Legionellales bacterium]|nr:uracil-DNA glycosylase [Legionellales bacterium]
MNHTANWTTLLGPEKQKHYFQSILQTIEQEKQQGLTIFPPQNAMFNAFKFTPIDAIRVVILGQDPYHGPNQAHGLCFSVLPPTKPPPSLGNIFKELLRDGQINQIPKHGSLENWARQGVFLLNTVLSVQANQANSHANIGWQTFTDRVIELINQHCHRVVFMLWGAQANKKISLLDPSKHLILSSTHPSPLSAHRGFLGCGHFSQANDYLKKHHGSTISWSD